jgi:hypothetical protein
MTWTYSGNPSNSQLDEVRFIIGDTDTTDQLLSNEEINYMIATHGASRYAASESCRAIAAKFARLMNRSIGGLSADFSAKYRQYLELSESIEAQEELVPVGPFASGWSRSGKEAVEADADREPIFGRKGVMDNPRANAVDDYYPYDYRRR